MEIFKVLLISSLMQTFGSTQTHLAKCLRDIALQNFAPGETVVISKSHYEQSNNGQHQRRLLTVTDGVFNPTSVEPDFYTSALEELHRLKQWPLQLCSTCEGVKHGTPSKHSGYIFLLQAQDLIQDMRNQLLSLKDMPDWNPRAKYIVVVTHCCFLSKKQSDSVEDILTELWNWNILNVIALIPTQTPQLQSNWNKVHRNSSKKSASEESFIPIFEVFARFSNTILNTCGQVTKATLINKWVSNAEDTGRFLYEIPLFGHRISGDFHECPIRASAFDYSPFFITMNTEKPTNKTFINEGLEFRLIKTISTATNMSVTFHPPPSGQDLWGRLTENGSWTGIVGQVLSGNSDVAVCGLYYTCHLSSGLECSVPYIFDETLWYLPCPKPFPYWLSLSRVFKLNLWIAFTFAYVIYSSMMWVSVTLNKKEGNHEGSYKNISECFLNFWAIILGVSACDKVPNNTTTRATFLLWVLYSFALSTVFQTFLTTFLINPGLEHEITTVDELLESGIEPGIPPTIDTILPDVTNSRYSRRTICTNMSSCFHRLASEGNLAVLCSKYHAEYNEATKYMDSDGRSFLCHLQETFALQLVTMVVQKGSFLLGKFNDLISRVTEAGLINVWWEDVKHIKILREAETIMTPGSTPIAMKLQHFQSAFTLLAFGFFLAVLCFVWEILHTPTCLIL
jgi:hypothetical protein